MKGRLRPNPNAVFTPQGGIQTRFETDLKATGMYDSIISNFMADRNVYRLIAIVACVLLVGCFALLAYVSTRPETELVVIGVNDIGETKYYGPAKGLSYDGYEVKEYIVSNLLQDFVKKTFTVSVDGELMYNNFAAAMCYLESDRRRNYELEIKERDPFKDVGRIKNVVTIETVIPVSGFSYQVDWSEGWQELHGGKTGVVRKRGIFTLRKVTAKQYNKLSDDIKVANPTGIFITDYNIVEKE